ncbi:unnamed protein product [Cyclocybe aegerita]|uniref:Uncharacterized protein n=1 Tax=Cyclocybe aegerita TaxID=1973307 RepID=A0A8S0VQN0_CYCAE|nr:unnamed protein product [Cyclocybe aegerita]
MTKHKLKLKRTPEEEAQRRLRKERKKEKKRKREQEGTYGSSKRVRSDDLGEGPSRKWASSDEDEVSSSSRVNKPDYDAIRAGIEEREFRAKMFDAMGDDERLDSLEAGFNDYAHVPDRWRTSGSGLRKDRTHYYDGDEYSKLDPRNMDDEEYAEWIRVGMYRKTHADEYAEQQRQKAAREARKAEEKARKAETARLEKIAEEECQIKKTERERHRLERARENYNMRWGALLGTGSAADAVHPVLSFDDIPWPILAAHGGRRPDHMGAGSGASSSSSIRVEQLTAENISSFLLERAVKSDSAAPDSLGEGDINAETAPKTERKEKLRETFLRFHPDKFEGRFMKRVREDEREKVREAIGQVSRALNSLMGDG